MPPVPRARSPIVYRLAFVLPLLALIYLVASGRWSTYFTVMRPSATPVSPDAFADSFATGLIWIASLAPLLILAWELGHQHTRARRLGFDIWVGLREAFRIAVTGDGMAAQAASFARAPTDRPGLAALIGLLVAIAVPLFFASVMPELRHSYPLIWLGVTGVLFGTITYCHLRAAAYLVDEPAHTLFRNWARLNPARYSEAGQPFIYWQIIAVIILPIWWIGGGALLAFHQ